MLGGLMSWRRKGRVSTALPSVLLVVSTMRMKRDVVVNVVELVSIVAANGTVARGLLFIGEKGMRLKQPGNDHIH